jgi:hypothetical protein
MKSIGDLERDLLKLDGSALSKIRVEGGGKAMSDNRKGIRTHDKGQAEEVEGKGAKGRKGDECQGNVSAESTGEGRDTCICTYIHVCKFIRIYVYIYPHL